MLEALWTVEFTSNVDVEGEGQPAEGSGILVFETNRLFGGDANFYYIGSYEVKDKKVYGKLKITSYTGNTLSIFGNLSEFDVVLEGESNDDEIFATGYLEQDHNYRIAAKMVKRADLP